MKVLKNDIDELVVQESDRLTRMVHQMVIKKNEIIDDFIYKNLETHILQAMKLKIENELMERKLKFNERSLAHEIS